MIFIMGAPVKPGLEMGENCPGSIQNVFVLEEQEALEKLNQALRPEVDASLLGPRAWRRQLPLILLCMKKAQRWMISWKRFPGRRR